MKRSTVVPALNIDFGAFLQQFTVNAGIPNLVPEALSMLDA
jgi:hypothetical protein